MRRNARRVYPETRGISLSNDLHTPLCYKNGRCTKLMCARQFQMEKREAKAFAPLLDNKRERRTFQNFRWRRPWRTSRIGDRYESTSINCVAKQSRRSRNGRGEWLAFLLQMLRARQRKLQANARCGCSIFPRKIYDIIIMRARVTHSVFSKAGGTRAKAGIRWILSFFFFTFVP